MINLKDQRPDDIRTRIHLMEDLLMHNSRFVVLTRGNSLWLERRILSDSRFAAAHESTFPLAEPFTGLDISEVKVVQ